MAKYSSPQLIISDHYDQLIREIDLHTEQLLEHFLDDALLIKHWNITEPEEIGLIPDLSEYDGPINDWLDIYNRQRNRLENVPKIEPSFDLSSTRVKDYLLKARAEILEVLAEARQENLDHLETIKTKLKSDREKINDPIVQEALRRQLFEHKFCFRLNPIQTNSHRRKDSFYMPDYFKTELKYYFKSFFGIHVIVSDFYLDQSELKVIEELLVNGCLYKFDVHYPIWETAVATFFEDLVYLSNCDLFLIQLSKRIILESVSKLSVGSSDILVVRPSLNLDHRTLNDIGFKRLTSLSIGCKNVQNMNCLPTSLEHLSLSVDNFLEASSFPCLPNLRFLNLSVSFASFDRLASDWLRSFPALQLLTLSFRTACMVDFRVLPYLTHLRIDIEFVWDEQAGEKLARSLQLNEGLQVLELNSSQALTPRVQCYLNHFGRNYKPEIKHFVHFFQSNNVTTLHITGDWKTHFDGAHLAGFPRLRRLTTGGSSFNFDYSFLHSVETLLIHHRNLYFDFVLMLVNLKHLAIDSSYCAFFSDVQLPNLTSLEILLCSVRDPKFFSLFPKLELLRMNSTCDFAFTPEVFIHLKNLRELYLRKALFSNSGAFQPLKKLEKLSLEGCSFRSAQSDFFEGLENLRELSLLDIPWHSWFQDPLKSFQLRMFVPLRNLQKLKLETGNNGIENDYKALVEFFVNETQIKAIEITRKLNKHVNFTRLIEPEKIRAQIS